MFVVRATRYRVRSEAREQFESLMREQAGRVKDLAPGAVLYALCRRRLDASLLPQPVPETVEYILHAAVQDAESTHQMETVEEMNEPHVEALLTLEPEFERIENPEFVVGLTRELDWSPQSVWRLSIFRMRIQKDADAEVQAAAQRLIGRMQENEPDPPVYTLTRRKGSSSFLPAAPSGRTEYIRFHAYQTEAALDLHHELDEQWWGPFYRSHLDGPLESIQFDAEDMVCGFTREAVWGTPTPYGER